jgi:hypothetical protein
VLLGVRRSIVVLLAAGLLGAARAVVERARRQIKPQNPAPGPAATEVHWRRQLLEERVLTTWCPPRCRSRARPPGIAGTHDRRSAHPRPRVARRATCVLGVASDHDDPCCSRCGEVEVALSAGVVTARSATISPFFLGDDSLVFRRGPGLRGGRRVRRDEARRRSIAPSCVLAIAARAASDDGGGQGVRSGAVRRRSAVGNDDDSRPGPASRRSSRCGRRRGRGACELAARSTPAGRVESPRAQQSGARRLGARGTEYGARRSSAARDAVVQRPGLRRGATRSRSG